MAGYMGAQAPNQGQRVVAIVAVDPTNFLATGRTREQSEVTIDLRFHVGAVHVMPTIGEQWYIAKSDASYYKLVSKIPHNTPELLTPPAVGQTQVYASGPLQLHGTTVVVNGPLCLPPYTTATRPTGVPAGAAIYDTTLSLPVFFDGTSWRNAAGTVV